MSDLDKFCLASEFRRFPESHEFSRVGSNPTGPAKPAPRYIMVLWKRIARMWQRKGVLSETALIQCMVLTHELEEAPILADVTAISGHSLSSDDMLGR